MVVLTPCGPLHELGASFESPRSSRVRPAHRLLPGPTSCRASLGRFCRAYIAPHATRGAPDSLRVPDLRSGGDAEIAREFTVAHTHTGRAADESGPLDAEHGSSILVQGSVLLPRRQAGVPSSQTALPHFPVSNQREADEEEEMVGVFCPPCCQPGKCRIGRQAKQWLFTGRNGMGARQDANLRTWGI